MNSSVKAQKVTAIFTKLLAVATVLLIWWGAATTSMEAGMVFADWPLSEGSINPEGWLNNISRFLEHGHRLIAASVGMMTLTLFACVYVRRTGKWLEVLGLVIVLAITFKFFIAAGDERESADRKFALLLIGLLLSFVPVCWLIWSWTKRDWRLLEKLSALALLMVTAQAILGGLRVTEISNTFAVIHGCLAQAFFCLVVLLMLMASKRWKSLFFSPGGVAGKRWIGVGLTVLVSLQLVWGASMRHFHRSGLADEGLLKTQGQWIPSFDEPIIAVLFLHKLTAFLILFFCIGAFLVARRWPRARKHLGIMLVILVVQIALGLTVIATGKHFWITNFHVLSGLAILALSFTFFIRSLRTKPGPGSSGVGATS